MIILTWAGNALSWMTANYQFLATVVLAVATLYMVRSVRLQTQATNKVAEETIWANQEEFYARMMVDAQGNDDKKRRRALSALEHIAGAWGNARHRDEIIRLFRQMALDDTETKGFDLRGRSAVWERHGVLYERASGPAVDPVEQKPSLLRYLASAWMRWSEWDWDRMPMYRVHTKDVKRSFELGAQTIAKIEHSYRRSGHKVLGYGNGRAWLRVGKEESLKRFADPEDIAWGMLPRSLRGGEWWLPLEVLAGENDRFHLDVVLKCVFSRSARSGEWQLEVRLTDDSAKQGQVWAWRGDTGPQWLSRQYEMMSEVQEGCDAGMKALGYRMLMAYGRSKTNGT